MAMVRAQPSAHELVAGRYRPLRVVHCDTNLLRWYGEDVVGRRPRLLTRIGLPADAAAPAAARLIADRVLRTPETVGRLRPGRVAALVDAVTEDGALWTVSEWIDAPSLAELIAEDGPLTCARTARIGLELLDVLDAAHAEGVTHGELGPAQVFVPDRGGLVVSGFGLAGATLAPRLTAPSFASPEQARDERVGPAADLWALGALLYAMVEGRPPFSDRGRAEATLRAVDRLPLRAPVRCGPLAPAVEGLLRKDSLERMARAAVRDTLLQALADEADDPGASGPDVPWSRLRPARASGRAAPRRTGRAGGGRVRAAVGAVAVIAVVAGAVALAATRQHHGPGAVATGAATAARPSAPPRIPTAGDAPPAPSTPSTGSSPSGSPSSGTRAPTASPTGFRLYRASEGFSVALPVGWRRLRTTRAAGPSYRVVFGASGDARTLAVTHSEHLGPDPVAIWRDDVQPALERQGSFQRIGDIRATTYLGRPAADMEWLSTDGDVRVRTFGRGVLLGGGSGFSLRWAAPADAFGAAANRRALDAVLRGFRPPPG
ncbi:serine/threonine-protein kinase [Streptomyces sp. NPDC046985]|uniref:serine/threonine-protein kinase n=1 Tax=Streptomyces sp. NPDC046985 TaxID=3155377 RepID=UPI0033E54282